MIKYKQILFNDEHMSTFLRAAADSDIGLVRPENQDSVYAWSYNPAEDTARALLIVSDGIGGYEAGDIASKITTSTISQLLVPFLESSWNEIDQPAFTLENRLREAALKANLAVWQYAQNKLGNNTGCTLTCIGIQDQYATLAHVGDSRAYLLDQHRLRQLTIDHTPAGELYELGLIDLEEMLTHPQRHVLTRAIGVSPIIDIVVDTFRLHDGDRILLCTDGLSGYIPDIVIERLLSHARNPKSVVKELIAAANAYGGSDNIGVAVCDVLVNAPTMAS